MKLTKFEKIVASPIAESRTWKDTFEEFDSGTPDTEKWLIRWIVVPGFILIVARLVYMVLHALI